MAHEHEPSQDVGQPQIDFGEDARREALANGTGFSPHTIDTILTGIDSDTDYSGLALRVREAGRRGGAYRGGRSYNEGSDSDVDPHWNVQGTVQPTPEERKASHEAYLEARALTARITGVALYDRLVKTAADHGVSTDTLLRAREDRAARNKSA